MFNLLGRSIAVLVFGVIPLFLINSFFIGDMMIIEEVSLVQKVTRKLTNIQQKKNK